MQIENKKGKNSHIYAKNVEIYKICSDWSNA